MYSETSTGVMEQLTRELRAHVSATTVRAVVQVVLRHCGMTPAQLERSGLSPEVAERIERGLSNYLRDDSSRAACQRILGGMVAGSARAGEKTAGPVRVAIEHERDIVEARNQVRDLARRVGFSHTDQIKIATAVSEVSRNIYKYAGRGELVAEAANNGRRGVRIRAVDRGPGILNLEEVLAGSYRSKTGMGLGLRGCRNLMSDFKVHTRPGAGTTVTMARYL